MDKNNKGLVRKTTAPLTLASALEDTSSEEEGSIGSLARQPQSLASSRREQPSVNYEKQGRKGSYTMQDWDDDDEDDQQMKEIAKKAKQDVQMKKDKYAEETKEVVTPKSSTPKKYEARNEVTLKQDEVLI